jgi:hypothetical protein
MYVPGGSGLTFHLRRDLMKKVILAVVVAGLFAGAAVGQALAQEKKTEFSLNLGVQTDIWKGTSFDWAWFTVDARAGFALGRSFEVSPEVMFVLYNIEDYHSVLVYPGVMVNYKAGNFFAGAGVVLPIAFSGGESDTGNLAPKINIGYKFGKFAITLYAITYTESGLKFLDVNYVGATIGYRF